VARTDLPSKTSEMVGLWKDNLQALPSSPALIDWWSGRVARIDLRSSFNIQGPALPDGLSLFPIPSSHQLRLQ
jgi:hypothetical protein